MPPVRRIELTLRNILLTMRAGHLCMFSIGAAAEQDGSSFTSTLLRRCLSGAVSLRARVVGSWCIVYSVSVALAVALRWWRVARTPVRPLLGGMNANSHNCRPPPAQGASNRVHAIYRSIVNRSILTIWNWADPLGLRPMRRERYRRQVRRRGQLRRR